MLEPAMVSQEFKEDLLRAAEIPGISVSAFIVRNLKPHTNGLSERQSGWELNREQSVKFVNALQADQKPRPVLRDLSDRYLKSGLCE